MSSMTVSRHLTSNGDVKRFSSRADAINSLAKRFRGEADDDAGLHGDRRMALEISPGLFESRADQAEGTGEAGGFNVGDVLAGFLVARLTQGNPLLTWATIAEAPEPAGLLSVAICDDTTNAGHILAENTLDDDLGFEFGELQLPSFKYTSSLIKYSMELAQDSPGLFVANLGTLLGARIDRASGADFTTGSGVGEPTGLMTAATDSTVVAAGATPTVAELLNLKASVDAEYYSSPKCAWMMAPATWRAIKGTLVANTSWVLVPKSTPEGYDLLDGHAVVLNRHMPTGTSAKAVIFGDLSRYIIRADRLLSLRIFTERFVELGQLAAVAILRLGGGLADVEAVKYLTLAT